MYALLFHTRVGTAVIPRATTSTSVVFMDVGQGDATLITDGKTQMLVDCGISDIILSALGRNMPYFDRTIEYLVVSHADADHFGGCASVLRSYDVERVYYNGLAEDGKDPKWTAFAAAVREEGLVLEPVDRLIGWDIGGAQVETLFPNFAITRTWRSTPTSKAITDNNASVVIRVSVNGVGRVLILGDAEVEQEAYLAATYTRGELMVDVLRTGHHGSKTSSTDVLLRAVGARTAIISSGKENRYGHPHERVLSRLERYGMHVRRTDIEGDITTVLY